MDTGAAPTTHPTTESLVTAWRNGDIGARDALVTAISAELELIARRQMRGERRRISFATDDLVNEAMVKLLETETLQINNRAHLLALFANIMRNTLIDAARRRKRQKRGDVAVTLISGLNAAGDIDVGILSLDHALKRLRAIHPQSAEIVEMRFFGAMSLEDIAAVIDVSPSTVKRSLRVARAWLKGAIGNDFEY